ncbi:MAG: RnfABCDGE type electron transport complex subunit G [Peptostreptococcaceae bacterium]|nr:RnfABCDGE type electron transport complex subunit G [Peptostreptococcaceae bacterium]
MKNDVVRLGLILAIISLVASGILASVNNITAPIIEQKELEAKELARKELLPDASSFEKVEGNFGEEVVEVYKAIGSSDEIGYIITTKTKGYGGAFDVITGIKKDGTVAGVKLGTLNETPGLGAKATEPKFIEQFMALSTEKEVFVSKNATGAESEIVAISGATITSNAVSSGVNAAIALYKSELS